MDALGSLTQFQSLQNQMLAQQHRQMQQARNGSSTPQPGSLIVHDSFEYSTPVATPGGLQLIPPPPTHSGSRHGEVAIFAAREHGFSGNVVKREVGPDPQGSQATAAQQALYLRPMDKQEALGTVRTAIGANAASVLNVQANMLNQNTDSGARNTAVNISLGTSSARMTEQHYGDLMSRLNSDKPEVAQQARTALGNYAAAFEFDQSKFLDADPKVSGPEKRKLLQGLINESTNVLENSRGVQTARTNYDQAVSRFEANNNSVVISAGNEGGVAERLSREAPGLRFPPNFSKNVLENDEVTSVGATRWLESKDGLKEQAAPYTSGSDGVDIYASGSVGFRDPNRKEVWGTSYGSPRVGAAMAELHRQNPEMSSAQVEALMKSRLTHQLPDNGRDLSVLDFGKTYEFLKTQTY